MPTEGAGTDVQPFFTAAGAAIGGTIVYIFRFFQGRKAEEQSPGKQLVLQEADLADLSVVKDLAAQLKSMMARMDDLADFRDDMEATKQTTLRIAKLLERLEERFAALELSEARRQGREEGERSRREGR